MGTVTTRTPFSPELVAALRAVKYIRANDCDFLTVENVADYAQLDAVRNDDVIRAALADTMGVEWYRQMVEAELDARGWDRIPAQRLVVAAMPLNQRPRAFAVVDGRRWTRISEYLSNGQLTARWFVDEATGEAREADGCRKPKRWPMHASAQEFARIIVRFAREQDLPPGYRNELARRRADR